MNEPGSSAKRRRTYFYHEEWEHDFLVSCIGGRVICLICDFEFATTRKYNISRHFTKMHGNYDNDYPVNSELRRCEIAELIKSKEIKHVRNLEMEKNATLKLRKVTMASFRVAHVLAKRMKPSLDAELLKEAAKTLVTTLIDDEITKGEFISCLEDPLSTRGDSISDRIDFIGANFKEQLKTLMRTLIDDESMEAEFISCLEDVPLSRNTVTNRIEAISTNFREQLINDLDEAQFFSLQLDHSMDPAQLSLFVRMVFRDCPAKQEILRIIPLKNDANGRDVYRALKTCLMENSVQLCKLASITTDGTQVMTDSTEGLIALCRQDDDFPPFVSYHSVIYPEALCARVLDFTHIMDTVTEVISEIRNGSLQLTAFSSLLREVEAEYGDLSWHSEIRWIVRGKVLQKFHEGIKFLGSLSGKDKMIRDSNWLLDLGFLTDFMEKLNQLNSQLQEKDGTFCTMLSSVNAFRGKLNVWMRMLRSNDFNDQFPYLQETVDRLNLQNFSAEPFSKHLEKIQENFQRRFSDFGEIKPLVSFSVNPFVDTDTRKMAMAMADAFCINPIDAELELITLQSDIELEALRRERNFWSFVSREKYPLIVSVVQKMSSFFGSTNLCEITFLRMRHIKSKLKTKLADKNLDNLLRIATTSYEPDFEKLVANMQWQRAHNPRREGFELEL